jgi:hypothetical protein
MADLDELKDFQKWKAACATILGEPFPPESSDFGPETLERDSLVDLSKKSNWALACEEILDTEHSHVYLRKCYEELRRRGKSDGEIQEMRRFAWHTAGWLNFPMMVWDWCSLDEKDVERAIDWLLRDRQISKEEQSDMLSFLKAHA